MERAAYFILNTGLGSHYSASSATLSSTDTSAKVFRPEFLVLLYLGRMVILGCGAVAFSDFLGVA